MLTELHVHDFDQVFQLMEASFPPTEHRTREDQYALLTSHSKYRLYGAKDGEILCAFLAVWELDRVLFLEHFATAPELRGKGLGTRLLAELGEMTDKIICLEVEPPETEIAARRIEFYKRCGFCLNPYPYIQPSLAKGQPAIPLMLMTHGRPIDPVEFEDIRAEIYHEVYHCAPETQPWIEMIALAKHNLRTAKDCKHAQTLVFKNTDGACESFWLHPTADDADAEEDALVSNLVAKNLTHLEAIVCMWYNFCIDVPSYSLRKKLIGLDNQNRKTNLVVLTMNGYDTIPMEKTVRLDS